MGLALRLSHPLESCPNPPLPRIASGRVGAGWIRSRPCSSCFWGLTSSWGRDHVGSAAATRVQQSTVRCRMGFGRGRIPRSVGRPVRPDGNPKPSTPVVGGLRTTARGASRSSHRDPGDRCTSPSGSPSRNALGPRRPAPPRRHRRRSHPTSTGVPPGPSTTCYRAGPPETRPTDPGSVVGPRVPTS